MAWRAHEIEDPLQVLQFAVDLAVAHVADALAYSLALVGDDCHIGKDRIAIVK
jgi:hypothetical protein